MRMSPEVLDGIIDVKLSDLHSQYLKHLKKGDNSTADLVEAVAMDICEEQMGEGEFLVLRIKNER